MNRFTIYITTVALAVLIAACDKQLSKPPANARVEGTAITNQKTAQTALNGAYYRFANVTSNNITDWTNNQVIDGMLAGLLGYGFGQRIEEKNDNVSSTLVPPMWDQYYALINTANGVIDGVNTVSDGAFTGNRKNEILAESRFLRAYGHFKLLVHFAVWNDISSAYGVLLRDKLSTLSNIPGTRSSVADSYQFILDDLDFAIANAPATNPAWYANKWAAMALKLRVLICRGQAADYTSMITLADNIIQNSPYVLENNLKDIFQSKGLSSKEVILGVKPQANQEISRYALTKSYAGATYTGKQPFKDLLQNDPRGTWMLGNKTPYQSYSPNTYYFTKYIPFGSTPSQLTETSYALRLTEVYLLKAEALIRSGGDLNMAKTLIKTVMGKAGVTDFSAVDNAVTADDLLMQNFYEVERNLTGEDGIEWLALMRLPFATVKQLRPTITLPQQLYFPVPLTEFNLNPSFGDQNPGYGK